MRDTQWNHSDFVQSILIQFRRRQNSTYINFHALSYNLYCSQDPMNRRIRRPHFHLNTKLNFHLCRDFDWRQRRRCKHPVQCFRRLSTNSVPVSMQQLLICCDEPSNRCGNSKGNWNSPIRFVNAKVIACQSVWAMPDDCHLMWTF